MSSMESSSLPFDIIYEIFSRASNNTLARCRVASKEWNKMTYDSEFNILHSQITSIADGFFARHLINNKHDCSFASITDETCKVSLDFVPGSNVSLDAVDANHGIILCKSDSPRRYYIPSFFVCKPRIKLFQKIPNPKTKYWTEGVAISVVRSNPFRYKILRISSFKEIFMKNYRMLICEVFDSDTWAWKRLKDIRLANYMTFMGRDPAVTACGSFYWLIRPDLVFSYDVQKEEWKTHELPIKEDDYDYIRLVEYEGKLALICMDLKCYMHTWVLENYKNQEWKNKFSINMNDPDNDHLYYNFVSFYGSDVMVLREYCSLTYYNFKKGKILKETKLEKDIFPRSLIPFRSDSEPCCLRGSLEKGEEEAQRSMKERGGS